MSTDPLSSAFAALAGPKRRATPARLTQGEATIANFAEPCAVTGASASKQLIVVEKAGLIAQSRKANWRPRGTEVEQPQALTAWLAFYGPLWEVRFDRRTGGNPPIFNGVHS